MPQDTGSGYVRMTYRELAAARGIQPASAEHLARLHKWDKVTGNDGVVVVSVPVAFSLVDPQARSAPKRRRRSRVRVRPSDPSTVPPSDPDAILAQLEALLTPLARQLELKDATIERLQAELHEARTERDQVQVVLDEVRATADRRRRFRRWWMRGPLPSEG